MNNNSSSNDIRLAAVRESYRDGLTEIVMGALLFIVALAAGRPAFYWTYLVAILLLGPGLKRMKARITYPRIGYAKIPDEDPGRLRSGILSGILGVFLVVAVVLGTTGHLTDNLAWRRAAPALGGLLLGCGLLYLARQSRLVRHWILTALSVVTGLLMVFANVTEPYGNLRVWALVMGLICLANGTVVLNHFVRSTPVVEQRMPDEE